MGHTDEHAAQLPPRVPRSWPGARARAQRPDPPDSRGGGPGGRALAGSGPRRDCAAEIAPGQQRQTRSTPAPRQTTRHQGNPVGRLIRSGSCRDAERRSLAAIPQYRVRETHRSVRRRVTRPPPRPSPHGRTAGRARSRSWRPTHARGPVLRGGRDPLTVGAPKPLPARRPRGRGGRPARRRSQRPTPARCGHRTRQRSAARWATRRRRIPGWRGRGGRPARYPVVASHTAPCSPRRGRDPPPIGRPGPHR